MSLSLFFGNMVTNGCFVITPPLKNIEKRKKKRALTNREKLWKLVNKRVKKVKYTLNPNSHFYEDEIPVVRRDIVPDRGYDDDSFQWAKVASNIDWSGLLTTVDSESYVGDELENEVTENKVTENPPLLFDFDDFDIEDVVYEKMWN